MMFFYLPEQLVFFSHRHRTCYFYPCMVSVLYAGLEIFNQTSEPEDANKKKNKRQLEVNAAKKLEQ